MQNREQHRPAAQVRAKARHAIEASWQSQANLSFFLVLLVLIAFVLPVLGFGREHLQLYAGAAYGLLLISGVALAWGQPWLMAIAGAIGACSVVLRWINLESHSTAHQLWADGSSIAALLAIICILLSQVFRPGRVGYHRIQGAIAVYLLFGAAYAHAYHIVGLLQPGSFHVGDTPMADVSDWIYYSFTTLTTVGYGDITATRPTARILSVGEALTGQLYLAVLIARLVAMEVIAWQESKSNNVS